MTFGLDKKNFELLIQLVILPLEKRKVQVFVFGSRARGTNHPFSDIDLLYIEDQNQPIDSVFLSSIKETIENSNFPIKVDLVNDRDLAQSYRAKVEQEKIMISGHSEK